MMPTASRCADDDDSDDDDVEDIGYCTADGFFIPSKSDFDPWINTEDLRAYRAARAARAAAKAAASAAASSGVYFVRPRRAKIVDESTLPANLFASCSRSSDATRTSVLNVAHTSSKATSSSSACDPGFLSDGISSGAKVELPRRKKQARKDMNPEQLNAAREKDKAKRARKKARDSAQKAASHIIEGVVPDVARAEALQSTKERVLEHARERLAHKRIHDEGVTERNAELQAHRRLHVSEEAKQYEHDLTNEQRGRKRNCPGTASQEGMNLATAFRKELPGYKDMTLCWNRRCLNCHCLFLSSSSPEFRKKCCWDGAVLAGDSNMPLLFPLLPSIDALLKGPDSVAFSSAAISYNNILSLGECECDICLQWLHFTAI
jgi:hypothetical protein